MKTATRLFPLLGLIFVMLCPLAAEIVASGEVDTTFSGYLAKLGEGGAQRFAIQPDGKIVVGGTFTMVNGLSKRSMVRFNADGTVDPIFTAPTIGIPTAIGVQSNGKIVVGLPGTLRRLNPDGSYDTAFNSSPAVAGVQYVYDLVVTPDDKIVLSGVRATSFVISRFNADGSLDAETTLTNFVVTLAVAPDGKVVYVNGALSPVRRLNQNLTPDNTFAPVAINNQAYKLIVQPDGKTLIQGLITQVNGTSSPRLVRANLDGTIDVPFVVNTATGSNSIYALDLLPNGKILSGLTLRNPDGTVDGSFSPSTSFVASDVKQQTDGKIIATGTNATDIQSSIVRYYLNGAPDTSFQPAVGVYAYGRKVIVQPDNKMLVSGDFNYTGGSLRRPPTRLNADGTVDSTFNVSTDYEILEVAPDGKIFVIKSDRVYRLNSDGSLDITFPGVFPNLNDLKVLPDGRVLIARVNNLYRYNADGILDSPFTVATSGTLYKIALQPDGKIVIGGTFTIISGTARSKIGRLNSDGTVDMSFNSPAGSIDGGVLNIENSHGGKFVISGSFTGISFNSRLGIARLNSDGSLDTGFVPPAISYLREDIRVQPDGKVLQGGVNRCERLNADGSVDTAFVCTLSANVGDDPRIRAIDIQSNGKIIVVGDFVRINGVHAPGIARLRSDSRSLFDYDGDGRSDVSVFRPFDNNWYVRRSSDSGITQQIFAVGGDVAAPADFDGDGKTDLAIFRPSNGDWWYLSSINNVQMNVHWGQTGDIPRPSDFDGDGRADHVVYRPSNSVWYRYGSTGQISQLAFGIAEDIPLIGDFDGDAKSDIAVFRPSVGDWWYASSASGEFRNIHWGATGDVPAPADYDGDGKTDLAVYRPSEGVWYIRNSGNGSFSGINFGLAGDRPVPADYDGDGRSDIAVFRPSTGIWYLNRSTAGFGAVNWGVSTDVPTPGAFFLKLGSRAETRPVGSVLWRRRNRTLPTGRVSAFDLWFNYHNDQL